MADRPGSRPPPWPPTAGTTSPCYEAGRRVGGQVLLAQLLPGRAEFGGAITNLEGEARRAGARIVTGSRVDADLLDQ